MARIRSVKPEFWTSEQVVECSPIARLLFVGMWNFADDGGVMKASAKTLKMQVFPADDFTAGDIQSMVEELIRNGLIVEFESENIRYWWVTGWHHQRIDKPSYKFPGPLNPKNRVDISTSPRRTFDEPSTSPRRALDDGVEGKGEERRGEEEEDANASLSPETADDHETGPADDRPPVNHICPAQKIADLYNRNCTKLPPAKLDAWSDANRKHLRSRWRWLMAQPIKDDPDGRKYADDHEAALAWFERFFRYVDNRCPHLNGENDRGWTANLIWLIQAGNFAKVIEGHYEPKIPRAAP